MAVTLDIKIKQDSLLLKQLSTPPETGLGESVLFLDSFSKEIKVRAENNGVVTGLSSSGGSEITRESLGAAASGANTDIVSLGMPLVTTTIFGALKLPNISRFSAYHPFDQSINVAEQYSKINLINVIHDHLNEYSDSRFTASAAGVYLFSSSVSVQINPSRPDWRIILTFYKNGVEAARGNDLPLPGLYGGTSANSLLFLEAGDYVELYLYSQYACSVFGGAAVTRMSGCRLG